jgi:tellurite methyltransferase
MARSERQHWEDRYRHNDADPGPPSPLLVEHAPLLCGELALDVATGRGRHALWLARNGFRVHAIDISSAAAAGLAARAREEHCAIAPLVADLDAFPLPTTTYDVVVNVNFLVRPLVPSLALALRPGGILLFETFLAEEGQRGDGHPRNRAHLLAPGELRQRLTGLVDILSYHEGPVQRGAEQVHLARLVGRRPVA